MNRKVLRRGAGLVVGGSIIGSAIGHGSVIANSTINWNGETGAARLEDLREAIALLRAEVEAASRGSTDTEEAQSELRQFEKELDKDKPDSEVVSIRWKLVQKLLDPLEHVASIAQLTNRIITLINGN